MSEISSLNPIEEIKETIVSLDATSDERDSEDFTLVSNDGKNFTLARGIAKMSGLVKNALSDKDKVSEATSIVKSTDIETETETELPVNVHSDELKLAIEYMKHHNGVEREPEQVVDRPLKSKIMSENVKDPWDAIFIDKLGKNPENADDVIRLCDAGNYLQIESLLHLASAKMASLIKGESTEKMKKLLQEDDDEGKQEEDDDSDDDTISEADTVATEIEEKKQN
jgi:S-phase kinase-associated protein 1